MKFSIRDDHIPVNKYRMDVAGIIPITFTTIGSFDIERDTVDLPDRTKASGGRSKAGEVEVKVPMHHYDQVAAMDAWFAEGLDPVSPTYKKVATMTLLSLTSLGQRSSTVIGANVSKKADPDKEMNDDGNMAEMAYTICWDDVI